MPIAQTWLEQCQSDANKLTSFLWSPDYCECCYLIKIHPQACRLHHYGIQHLEAWNQHASRKWHTGHEGHHGSSHSRVGAGASTQSSDFPTWWNPGSAQVPLLASRALLPNWLQRRMHANQQGHACTIHVWGTPELVRQLPSQLHSVSSHPPCWETHKEGMPPSHCLSDSWKAEKWRSVLLSPLAIPLAISSLLLQAAGEGPMQQTLSNTVLLTSSVARRGQNSQPGSSFPLRLSAPGEHHPAVQGRCREKLAAGASPPFSCGKLLKWSRASWVL